VQFGFEAAVIYIALREPIPDENDALTRDRRRDVLRPRFGCWQGKIHLRMGAWLGRTVLRLFAAIARRTFSFARFFGRAVFAGAGT
jgi:hypothetical protein